MSKRVDEGWKGATSGWFRGLLRRVPADSDGYGRIRARQIYILPTATGLLYGFVAGLMLIGSLNYQNNLAILFTFFMVSVGVVAMHLCWLDLLGLAVRVRARGEVFAGSPAAFDVTLVNERVRPRYDLGLDVGPSRTGTGFLDGFGQETINLNIPTVRRGELTLRELVVDSRHPMRLFRAWSLISCGATVLVYPRPALWAPMPLSRSGVDQERGTQGGDGTDDFEGPREYRRGDSLRRIDWKAFARHRGVVVKQFSAEQGGEVWIDWEGLQTADPEKRLSLLTRQVIDAAAANRRFGLRLPGIELAPGQGQSQTNRCLRELALCHVEDA